MTDVVGAQAQDAKMPEWLERFKYFRDPPSRERIQQWLNLFEAAHLDVAIKVLDHVTVVGERDILSGYKAALSAMPGWSAKAAARKGRWFFVGFGKQGESGPAMLRLFREANDLANACHDPLFKSLSDLPSLQLTAYDHVVFVDDFSGTGRQVTRLWPRVAELVASEAKCYLVLTAITEVAKKSIEEKTELELSAQYTLGSEHSVFLGENQIFSEDEKIVIQEYCASADPRNPKGFGDLGMLFILSHKTPNNVLPILYQNTDQWRGLFPRYLRAA
jgi:hypothetical protein